jgi:ABC-type glycerol-3-phosphate transport system substrate-binding protein
MSSRNVTRRELIKGIAGACGAALLASCAPKVVEKEKIVRETVVVAGTPQVVEKKVEVTSVPGSGGARATVGKAGTPIWKAPDLTGKTYTLWGLQYDPHVQTYERLAKWFEAYTGAKASVEPQQGDIGTNLITAMAAGTPPDVICLMGTSTLPLVLQDALVPVDDLVFAPMNMKPAEWFAPVSLQSYQHWGRTYGVPVEGNATTGVVNIRMDYVQAAGKQIQDMWPVNQKQAGFASVDDLWALAKALMVTEKDGTVSRWGLSSQGWDHENWFSIMRMLGKDWWDGGAQKFNLNSPEAEEAMHIHAYKPIFDLKIETQYTDNVFYTAMFAGLCAVGIGNVVIPGMGRDQNIHVEQCIYPPAVKGKKPLFVGEGGWGFVLPAQSKKKEIGVEFCKYMTTYDGQREYARIYGGMIPGAPAVAEDPEIFPKDNYIGQGLTRVAPAQRDMVYFGSGFGTIGEMGTICGAAVTKVRSGEMKVKPAIDEAQKLCDEMFGRFREELKKVGKG